jgi:pyridoxine/pyridoxamine 5'-phosphate oxidase
MAVPPSIDIGDDERFSRAIALFNEREYAEAADLFEELFFEAVLGEVELARALLQIATGAHHVERGQRRVAIERIDEGLIALRAVSDSRGIDLAKLSEAVAEFVAWIEDQRSVPPAPWPSIVRR